MTSSREREDDLPGSRATTASPVPGALMEHTLGLVRRYPLSALVTAGVAAWALYGLSRRSRDRYDRRVELLEEESIPVLNIGQARIYDPDTSPRHPTQDLLETRRETSARA
ncbi:MAG: hypothetical protein ACJ8DT_08515 [Microvirga sp.]